MKRPVVPFLKRPDTSSHGLTLGLCDSLREHRQRKLDTARWIAAAVLHTPKADPR